MPSERAKKHMGIGESSTDLGLQIDGFVWESLVEEATRLGVSVEELAAFAIAYYMADLDSGRIARKVPGFMRRGLTGLRPIGEEEDAE